MIDTEVYANSVEELYAKKALRKKELQDNIIIYDSRICVDAWAEKAFDTYKQGTAGLEDTKARYRKYISPIHLFALQSVIITYRSIYSLKVVRNTDVEHPFRALSCCISV